MRVVFTFLMAVMLPVFAAAQDSTIAVSGGPSDADIQARISAIYAQLSDTQDVVVTVSSGVVTLSGEAPNREAADHALEIAQRVDGVIAVQETIDRTLAVSENVSPLLIQLRDWGSQLFRALPLIGAALLSLIAIILFGRWLSRRQSLIKRLAGNPFLAELLQTAIKLIFILIGLVVALNILGATALIGTVLGGAGIIGIALGFGIRDTVENYIASLLLSIRQPFRAQDHVIIDGQEGIVVRLNTRATILMTPDGNHLRIPNAKVFKADILNYSTNPTRRFKFGVGVDSADDPVAAIKTGVKTLLDLPFVLPSPAPMGVIKEIGDSSILIDYYGWVDQRETDFGSARSQAIRDVIEVLEAEGFSLPEPIYRVKLDGAMPAQTKTSSHSKTESKPSSKTSFKAQSPQAGEADAALNTDADLSLTQRVAQERQDMKQTDLLDEQAPKE